MRRKAKQPMLILDGMKRQKTQHQSQLTGIGWTGMNITGWQEAENTVWIKQVGHTHTFLCIALGRQSWLAVSLVF